MNDFEKIDYLLNKLNSLRPLTEGELAYLLEDFAISFAYNSNAIEGCSLTYDETALVLKEHITINQKPLKDHMDVLGHKQAFDFVQESIKNKANLSVDFIKQIHKNVLISMPNDAGSFRRLNVRIGNMLTTVFTPPPFNEVENRINELINS